MKTRIAIAAVGLLAGCSTVSLNQPTGNSGQPVRTGQRDETSSAAPVRSASTLSVDRYKRTLAQHIAELNPDKVYSGNPQAMLRSVVVIKYVVDSNGRLVRSDTLRSNGDSATIATALSALRNAAPFPHPPASLLDHGRLEILETMLFNDDGRFQLRSIASAQMSE